MPSQADIKKWNKLVDDLFQLDKDFPFLSQINDGDSDMQPKVTAPAGVRGDIPVVVAAAEFDEDKHPRGHGGKFTSGGNDPVAAARASLEKGRHQLEIEGKIPPTAEQLLGTRTPKGDVTFYHGTSDEAWKTIQKEGLIPHKGEGGDAWAKAHGFGDMVYNVGDRHASVYMSRDKAESAKFAELATQQVGGHPLMLKVTVPKEAIGKIRRDEQDYAAVRFEGKIPASWITRDTSRLPDVSDEIASMTRGASTLARSRGFAEDSGNVFYAVMVCDEGRSLAEWDEDAHPRDGHGRFGAGAAGPKGEKDDHVPDSVKDTMFAKGLDASQWHDHAVKMIHDLDAAHADDPTWNQNVSSVQAAMANFPMIHTAQLGNIEDIAKVGLQPASDFHAGLTFDKISGLDRTVFMRMGQAGGGGHGAVGVMVDPTKLDTSNFIVTKLGAMTLKQDEEAFLKTPGDHSALVGSQLAPYRDSTISYRDLPAVQSRLLVNGYEKDNPGTRGTVISPEKIVANDHGEMEVKFAGRIPPEALVGFFAGDQPLSQFGNKSAYDYLKGKVPDAKLIKYSGEGLHQLSTAYRAYYAPGQKHRERIFAVVRGSVRMDDGEDFESQHPRGHGGKFMTKEQKIEAAKEHDAATPHITFGSAVPPVPANFASLPQADRDKYTDAAHTIPARIEELTAGHEWPRTENVQADIAARMEQFKDRLAPEAQRMIQGDVHEFARQLDALAGQKEPEAYRTLVEKYTDVAVANSVEAAAHVLSDHGEHHGLGNAEMANNILGARGGLSQLDRVENSILGTFHDAGYMTPAGRQFATGDHPRNGMQYYDAHVRDAVAALIGDQRANEISRIIGTHQDTKMDWKGDPRAAAFRLADNLAVFAQEKTPPLFRYVPGNKDVMDRWTAGKMSTAEAQKAISDNVRLAALPLPLKDQLQRAAGEVKDSLPKFIGGMWSGTVDNISWSAHDRSPVISVLNNGNDALKERLDMGQKQFDKLAETFGRSIKDFAKSPTMQLKDGKRVVATIKVHGRTIKAS